MLGEMTQMMMLAEEMTSSYVAAVVVTGLVVVFACLIILVLFLYLMGAIFNKSKKSKTDGGLGSEAKNVSAAKVELTKISDVAVLPSNSINEEIVAAISAAIAMIGENSGKKLLIKSISKSVSRRSSWAQAGRIDNTRPF